MEQAVLGSAVLSVDHATEFKSKVLDEWCYQIGVRLEIIRLGKTIENGMIESFNGRLRYKCLNAHEFESIDHVPAALRRVARGQTALIVKR